MPSKLHWVGWWNLSASLEIKFYLHPRVKQAEQAIDFNVIYHEHAVLLLPNTLVIAFDIIILMYIFYFYCYLP